MKLGFLYAGQGSQHPGMGADLYAAYARFREVYDAAQLDFDLKQVSFKDKNGLIHQTEYTQPCMVAFAAGITAVLADKGIRPDVAAGLSLGEYSALHAAGVFDVQTAIGLAAYRGRAMADAAQGIDCAMAAVLGLDRDALQAACEEASARGMAAIANYNCPGQLVVGGERAAVEEALRLAKERGARRCVPLQVSGPFHTALMAPAGEKLRQIFAGMTFGQMRLPVIFNCLGDVMPVDGSIPELLVKQVQSAVYMEDSIRRMAGMADVLVEIGPGRALSGFVRRIAPETPVYAVETVSDVEKLLEVLS